MATGMKIPTIESKALSIAIKRAMATRELNTYTALWPERLDDVADAIGALRERELV